MTVATRSPLGGPPETPPSSLEEAPTVVVEPSHGWVALPLRDLWVYRELFYFLVWRDIKVRYKQTAIGAIWALLQPLLTMLIFTLLFGRLAGLSSDGKPYAVFVFTALLPWQLFTNALSQSGNSIVANQQLVTKVYFPRLIIPLAAILSGLVDFGLALVVLAGLMVFYGVVPTAAILLLPAMVLLAVASALAVGLWLSALNVQFRDVQYTIPFLTQLWFFITPIVYSASLVPGRYRFLFGINPMTGVVQGFRWAILGDAASVGPLLGVSCVMVVIGLLSGAMYFRRMERTFADLV